MGSLSILVLFLSSWRMGKAPAVDACLPMASECVRAMIRRRKAILLCSSPE
jgi:hypothetical protein